MKNWTFFTLRTYLNLLFCKIFTYTKNCTIVETESYCIYKIYDLTNKQWQIDPLIHSLTAFVIAWTRSKYVAINFLKFELKKNPTFPYSLHNSLLKKNIFFLKVSFFVQPIFLFLLLFFLNIKNTIFSIHRLFARSLSHAPTLGQYRATTKSFFFLKASFFELKRIIKKLSIEWKMHFAHLHYCCAIQKLVFDKKKIPNYKSHQKIIQKGLHIYWIESHSICRFNV